MNEYGLIDTDIAREFAPQVGHLVSKLRYIAKTNNLNAEEIRQLYRVVIADINLCCQEDVRVWSTNRRKELNNVIEPDW